MNKLIIFTACFGISTSACEECKWHLVPTPKPSREEVELCATAYNPYTCFKTLGYKLVDTCGMKEEP